MRQKETRELKVLWSLTIQLIKSKFALKQGKKT